MNKQVVTALVHSPVKERKKPSRNTLSGSDASKGDQEKKKHRRRWQASEVSKVFERNTELMKQMEILKERERSVTDSKTKLERELALLKSRKATGSHECEAVRERNRQLSQDVFLMKNILVKLNFELERYQEKLRNYEDDIPTQDTPSENRVNRCRKGARWIEGEVTVFAPLLHAYEESLKEKDDLIRDLRSAVEKISGKMKDIVKENSELRSKMADSEKKGEVTYSDWLSVNRELTITVEQNQLLTRQTKLAQSKISDLKSVFQSKLNEVCSERDDLGGKLTQIKTDYLVLRGKCSALEAEQERLKEDSSDRIPKSVHMAYISECKRLLDELKSRHEEERNSLMRKVATLEAESQKYRAPQPSTSTSDHKTVEVEKRMRELEERCEKAEKRRDFLKSRLNSMIAFSKELISEHESLLRAINGEMKVKTTLSSRIEQIKGQLKGVELDTLEQLRALDENINCQVERVKQVRVEQDAEVRKLKEKLAERDNEIKKLKEEARKREEDIEVVWKAALSDQREKTHDEIVLDFNTYGAVNNK